MKDNGFKRTAAWESTPFNALHGTWNIDGGQRSAEIVSIISWLSVLYVLNDRKVAIWILYGNEMAKI